MNTIPQQQVTPRQLDRLAAASQLYLNAKRILAVQMILSVPTVLGLSVMAAIFPALKAHVAYWGVAIAILNVVIFDPWQQGLKKKAALVQELFDCELFELNWQELRAGRRPNTEEVVKAAARYRRKYANPSWLENWYPVSIGQVPLHLARLICQRINCWWDGELRRRYSFWVVVVVVALTIIVFLIGLIGGFTLGRFFQVVLAPLTPALILGVREYNENQDAAANLDHLKEHAEQLWQSAIQKKLSPQELLVESRNLQDEIFSNRRKSPLIFNWIYRLFKQGQEDEMQRGAEALIKEAL